MFGHLSSHRTAFAGLAHAACLALMAFLVGGHAFAQQAPSVRALTGQAPEPSFAQQRQALEADFARRMQACESQFAVTPCKEALRRQRREALEPIRQQELGLVQAQRQRKANFKREQLAQRVRSDAGHDGGQTQSRTPASTPAPTAPASAANLAPQTQRAAQLPRAQAGPETVRDSKTARTGLGGKGAGQAKADAKAAAASAAQRRVQVAQARKAKALAAQARVQARQAQRVKRGAAADPLPAPR